MIVSAQTATVQINGMHCGGCASKISAALLELDGVETADVSSQHASQAARYPPMMRSAEPSHLRATTR